MCNSIRDAISVDLKDILQQNEVSILQTAVTEALERLEKNVNASKDMFDEQLTILKGICNPILTNAYQNIPIDNPGFGGMPGDEPFES
jgi:hypothetical protein